MVCTKLGSRDSPQANQSRDVSPGNIESHDLERDGKLPKLKSKSIHEPLVEDPAKRLMVRIFLPADSFLFCALIFEFKLSDSSYFGPFFQTCVDSSLADKFV